MKLEKTVTSFFCFGFVFFYLPILAARAEPIRCHLEKKRFICTDGLTAWTCQKTKCPLTSIIGNAILRDLLAPTSALVDLKDLRAKGHSSLSVETAMPISVQRVDGIEINLNETKKDHIVLKLKQTKSTGSVVNVRADLFLGQQGSSWAEFSYRFNQGIWRFQKELGGAIK